MKRLALAATLALAACGPIGPYEPPANAGLTQVGVEINNHYAESIFRLDWAPVSGEGGGRIFETVRVEANGKKLHTPALEVEAGTRIKFTIAAQSLGSWYTFSPVEVEAKRGTYRFTYEYDFATGGFQIFHGWKP